MPLSVASPLVPRILRAKDVSPAAIADAFARASAQTYPGPFGPIGQPAIYIPVPPEAPRPLVRPVPPRPLPSASSRTVLEQIRALDQIRAHRYAIGGYAALFNRVSVNQREMIAPGAFRRALTANANSFYLLLNHSEGVPSLASRAARTLHVEEDRAGLWFEASLPEGLDEARLFGLIAAGGATGVSTGSFGSRKDQMNGVCVFSELNTWELSILTLPSSPRFAGTWVMNNRDARRRRRLEC